MALFKDRYDAGKKLAQELKYHNDDVIAYNHHKI